MQIVIEIPEEVLKTRYYTDYFGCGSHKLTETLDNATPYSRKGHWIPVGERLPELAYGCLVTVKMDSMPLFESIPVVVPYAVGYDGEGWSDSEGITIPYEVIAWMPLPKPYKDVRGAE